MYPNLRMTKNENINILGIEPAQNIATVAIENGIPTESVYFTPDMNNSNESIISNRFGTSGISPCNHLILKVCRGRDSLGLSCYIAFLFQEA